MIATMIGPSLPCVDDECSTRKAIMLAATTITLTVRCVFRYYAVWSSIIPTKIAPTTPEKRHDPPIVAI